MHGSGAGRRRWIGWAVLALVVLGVLLGGARPAEAHPLGNFTTNRYARVEVSAGVLRVYYVLDEAELRAFETRDAVANDRDRFVADQVARIRDGLRLTVDGAALDLSPLPARLDLLPGQGGLDTQRLAVVFSASLPAGRGAQRGTFEDSNEPKRIGWREVVVVARGDARLLESSAPAADASDELRRYPAELLQAPLDQRSATFSFDAGSRPVDALALTPPIEAASRAGGELTRLVERQGLTPLVLAGMLGLAFVFGSFHAIGPGHGKTVMAAYLVGTSGRTADAVLLGVIVSLMHTGSVLVLGLALLQLNRYGAIERIYPLLTVLSGLIVVGFGAVLLRRRLRSLRATNRHHDHGDHLHDAEAHAHGEGHSHGEGHAHEEHAHEEHLQEDPTPREGHSHQDHAHGEDHAQGSHDHGHHHGPGGHTHELPEGIKPLSRRGLVLLATSGGLLPSPSAVLVVVAGFAAGRVALSLSLVLAFSVGLAATLSAVGIALVLGRRVLERRKHAGAIVRTLPVAGAAALMTVGLVLLASGVTQL
ncbi:MAG TPA: hypothetical protein VGP53_05690 [Acidimicrobiales bacterium]|nr:hypothetical protein [Acidimicrobiales bacterium]